MTTPTTDSLVDLFTEVRQQRPPVWHVTDWQRWLEAVGQVIAGFQTVERRWACVTLVADDLCQAMPGLSLTLAYHTIAQTVFVHEVKEGRR